MKTVDYRVENRLLQQGFTHAIGLDGVGLGAIYGPVTAAVTVFPLTHQIVGVYDSKSLSEKRMYALDTTIRSQAISVGVGEATVYEYNQYGPRQCELLAMNRAMRDAFLFDHLLVDASIALMFDGQYDLEDRYTVVGRLQIQGLDWVSAFPKADQLVFTVAAASILAKHHRDEKIKQMALTDVGYGLEDHVGYCTEQHVRGIRERGLTENHRKSAKKFALNRHPPVV